MEKLNETELREIAYNCKKATFLIEKQQFVKITIRERLILEIHLAGCSICRTFMQQSAMINQLAKKLFLVDNRLKLDAEFKNRLQRDIEKMLDKDQE